MRKVPFENGEFYHVYNRGVDKRNIFSDQNDITRFLQSMDEFNTLEPIGSIYENSFVKNQLGNPTSKLVNFICYCINPNHFHFILEQVADNGISNFMKRMSGGYAKYFNEKYKRSGALFQGRFKAIHIDSNPYLLHVSAYVNLNDRVHTYPLGNPTSKLVRSSWDEYTTKGSENFCKKDIILGQFEDPKEYNQFARESLQGIIERRYREGISKEVAEKFLLE